MAATIHLDKTSSKRLALSVALLFFLAIYLGLITTQFVASQFSEVPQQAYLRWAVRLDPFNAEYRDRDGRFELLRQSPASALPLLRDATRLNPYQANYWLDRASAEQLIGGRPAQREFLAHASAANPRSGGLAWELANRYVAQGNSNDALRQYRKVIENDPPLMPQALQICWNIRPDIDSLLQHVVPASAYGPFLAILLSQHQTDAAAQVWRSMVALQRPLSRRLLFDYVTYLFGEDQPMQAARVWQQAANLAGLSGYQPIEENLIVNGDFGLDVINGGFDWKYQKIPGVTLALDPIKGHSGSRSLRISFEGSGIGDAGIRELVAVEPNTQYEFSGYYEADSMEGAGGPKLAISDFYTGNNFFLSDDLRDANFWTRARGTFTTGADTHLLVVHIARMPAGSPIRGILWIDNLKLVAAHLTSAEKVQP